jgi:hypothetical protein
MGLLPHTIESASCCTTPDEVLHMGKGGHPREAARETITRETREKGECMQMERMGKMATKVLSPFQGQTSGAFIADRQTDRD